MSTLPKTKKCIPGKAKLGKKAKKEKLSTLKKKADAVFSLWVRARDRGACFTCRVVKPENQMQAGHYVSRSYLSLRFNERNVHCQCVACNIFKKGNLDEYAVRLVELYGKEILKNLHKKKWESVKFTGEDYKSIIQKYAQIESTKD